ncbi:hypothetical protein CSA80_05135 [Candidatus Saccharibacteria bacterium]|nr:MAG: hypothetical protein CSA80_05135 [Candidatus Saccharibacteria bacterium]
MAEATQYVSDTAAEVTSLLGRTVVAGRNEPPTTSGLMRILHAKPSAAWRESGARQAAKNGDFRTMYGQMLAKILGGPFALAEDIPTGPFACPAAELFFIRAVRLAQDPQGSQHTPIVHMLDGEPVAFTKGIGDSTTLALKTHEELGLFQDTINTSLTTPKPHKLPEVQGVYVHDLRKGKHRFKLIRAILRSAFPSFVIDNPAGYFSTKEEEEAHALGGQAIALAVQHLMRDETVPKTATKK